MDIQPENKAVEMTHELLSMKKRILLFFSSYMMLVIIGTAILFLPADSLNSLPSSDVWAFLLICLLFVFVYLPTGLVILIQWVLQHIFEMSIDLYVNDQGIPMAANHLGSILISLSYLLFISIALAGILTKNRRTFQILYYTFVGLLIVAIRGCAINQP